MMNAEKLVGGVLKARRRFGDELIGWQILLAGSGGLCYIGVVNGKLNLLLSSALLLRRAAVGL
jgi:hypothetical protein